MVIVNGCVKYPAGTWHIIDVVLTLLRRDDVASTSIQCHFGTVNASTDRTPLTTEKISASRNRTLDR